MRSFHFDARSLLLRSNQRLDLKTVQEWTGHTSTLSSLTKHPHLPYVISIDDRNTAHIWQLYPFHQNQNSKDPQLHPSFSFIHHSQFVSYASLIVRNEIFVHKESKRLYSVSFAALSATTAPHHLQTVLFSLWNAESCRVYQFHISERQCICLLDIPHSSFPLTGVFLTTEREECAVYLMGDEAISICPFQTSQENFQPTSVLPKFEAKLGNDSENEFQFVGVVASAPYSTCGVLSTPNPAVDSRLRSILVLFTICTRCRLSLWIFDGNAHLPLLTSPLSTTSASSLVDRTITALIVKQSCLNRLALGGFYF